jgi:hypothetical protein
MIIARLNGGLGNQMFQYANGKAKALELNTNLLLDITEFEAYPLHQGFELSKIFSGQFEIASSDQILQLKGVTYQGNLLKIASKFSKLMMKKSFIQEPHFQYWDGIKAVTDNSYLSGYWQSEKYLQEFQSEIITDFSFSTLLMGLNKAIASEIQRDDQTSISLHIRRGDYVSDPKAMAYHGLCSLDYYLKAIDYLNREVDKTHFFIFSDDPQWVQKNLHIKHPHTFVAHNSGEQSYQDMRLMSLCRHNIIANSSFSWWGAWLNLSKDKIVIAPKRWFAKPINSKDLIPSSWVRL